MWSEASQNGVRPGSLGEPRPQRSVHSLRRSSGDAPLLGVPSLADSSAEAIDGRTLRFLLKQNLAREEEKKKKRRRKLKEEAEHEAHMLVLDCRFKDGERLSSPEREAWRHWKSRVLGLPSQDDLETWT